MPHDTTIKHRFEWAVGQHHWWIECQSCGWISPMQRTAELAAEREAEHLDLPDADEREMRRELSQRQ